mmetsp:Transcript_12987/g.26353  ORF Transcript_12987/g.26353 Transcript_12987/m.26353 type:complete len:96 (+) Transcript_12987:154-441(+)
METRTSFLLFMDPPPGKKTELENASRSKSWMVVKRGSSEIARYVRTSERYIEAKGTQMVEGREKGITREESVSVVNRECEMRWNSPVNRINTRSR